MRKGHVCFGTLKRRQKALLKFGSNCGIRARGQSLFFLCKTLGKNLPHRDRPCGCGLKNALLFGGKIF